MATSTDVNLPREYTAIFPAQCVGCGGETDGNHVRLATHTVSWFNLIFWLFGRFVKIEVPACRRCMWRIRSGRWLGLLFVLAFAFVVLIFIWPHVDRFISPGFRRWARMGLLLVCMSPWAILSTFFPPPIDITAYTKSIDYQFANRTYAAEFAVLNENAPFVRIDGTELEDAGWVRAVTCAIEERDES